MTGVPLTVNETPSTGWADAPVSSSVTPRRSTRGSASAVMPTVCQSLDPASLPGLVDAVRHARRRAVLPQGSARLARWHSVRRRVRRRRRRMRGLLELVVLAGHTDLRRQASTRSDAASSRRQVHRDEAGALIEQLSQHAEDTEHTDHDSIGEPGQLHGNEAPMATESSHTAASPGSVPPAPPHRSGNAPRPHGSCARRDPSARRGTAPRSVRPRQAAAEARRAGAVVGGPRGRTATPGWIVMEP